MSRSPSGEQGPARLLVVHRSAFGRRILGKMVEGAADVAVAGVAADGREVLLRVQELDPDVVVLDLGISDPDGLSTVRALRQARPELPVVVLASAGPSGESEVFEALSLGSFDFIDTSGFTPMNLHVLGPELLAKVRAAAASRPGALPPSGERPAPAEASGIPANARIVCVGASTGGPRALQELVETLPASFPLPVAIVQHMAWGFTAAFAERLDRCSALEVREAREGDEIRPGRVLLAPAGSHLLFARTPQGERARLSAEPADAAHVPSVDVLFASAAEVYGGNVIGVVLTGMGADGREGARRLAERGAFLVAEDESTCAVYGMPKAIVTAGLARAVWPLPEIARRLSAIRSGGS